MTMQPMPSWSLYRLQWLCRIFQEIFFYYFKFLFLIPSKSSSWPLQFLIQPMARFLFVCYIGGFIALFLGNIFVADGCNFGELRGVSIFFGFLGISVIDGLHC